MTGFAAPLPSFQADFSECLASRPVLQAVVDIDSSAAAPVKRAAPEAEQVTPKKPRTGGENGESGFRRALRALTGSCSKRQDASVAATAKTTITGLVKQGMSASEVMGHPHVTQLVDRAEAAGVNLWEIFEAVEEDETAMANASSVTMRLDACSPSSGKALGGASLPPPPLSPSGCGFAGWEKPAAVLGEGYAPRVDRFAGSEKTLISLGEGYAPSVDRFAGSEKTEPFLGEGYAPSVDRFAGSEKTLISFGEGYAPPVDRFAGSEKMATSLGEGDAPSVDRFAGSEKTAAFLGEGYAPPVDRFAGSEKKAPFLQQN